MSYSNLWPELLGHATHSESIAATMDQNLGQDLSAARTEINLVNLDLV
jgi:hypothetical protein